MTPTSAREVEEVMDKVRQLIVDGGGDILIHNQTHDELVSRLTALVAVKEVLADSVPILSGVEWSIRHGTTFSPTEYEMLRQLIDRADTALAASKGAGQ